MGTMKKAAVIITLGVLSGVGALTIKTAPAAGKTCLVTVFLVSDIDPTTGALYPDASGFKAPCRPGEKNGDIEIYDVLDDKGTVVPDVPLVGFRRRPKSTSPHGTAPTSTASTSPPTNSNCTPAPTGSPKTHRATNSGKTPPKPTCPPTSTQTQPSNVQ